jgi:hypothetical protein
MDLPLPLEVGVTKEMRIDSPVHRGLAQARRKKVLKLFPHNFKIRFFVFHGYVSKAEIGFPSAVVGVRFSESLPEQAGG